MDTRTLKKIYNKLSQEDKTELKSEKVELALIDDLEKQYKKINIAKDEITKEASRIGKEIFNFRDTLNNFKTTQYIISIGDYEKAAKALGIKIDNKYQKSLNEYQDEKRKQAKRFFNR